MIETIQMNPDKSEGQDLPPLPVVDHDPTIDSKNKVLLANLAALATLGAPAAPDGITFIDMILMAPLGSSPLHATIFHAKVAGVWVDHFALDYLIAAFPFIVYNDLLHKGMITVGPGTPTVPVFQTEPTFDKPMIWNSRTVINGTNKNPGDFGFATPTPSTGVAAPPSGKVGSTGLFS